MHKYDTDKNYYIVCNYHSWTHYRFAHIFSFPTFQMFQMHHGNKPITSQSSFDSLKLNLTFVKKKIIFKNLFSSNCFLLMQMHVKYRKNPVSCLQNKNFFAHCLQTYRDKQSLTTFHFFKMYILHNTKIFFYLLMILIARQKQYSNFFY